MNNERDDDETHPPAVPPLKTPGTNPHPPDSWRRRIGDTLVEGRTFLDDHLREVRAANVAVLGISVLYLLSRTRLLHRYKSVRDIPASDFARKLTIKGNVLKVDDHGLLHVYHQPLVSRLLSGGRLPGRHRNKEGLQVQLFGVQNVHPYTKEWLQSRLVDDNELVSLSLVRAGGSDVAICHVGYRPNVLKVDVASALMGDGCARVKDVNVAGSDAVAEIREHAGVLDKLGAAEDAAREQRLGLWEYHVEEPASGTTDTGGVVARVFKSIFRKLRG